MLIGPILGLLGSVIPAKAVYVSTAHQGAATNYTYTAQGIGTAAANRYVIVCASSANSAAARSVSSLTIQGISATKLVEAQGSSATSGLDSIWIAAVPTGTTGDVVVNYSGAMIQSEIFVYSVTGLLSTTPVATYTDSSAASGTRTFSSVNEPANGFTIGLAGIRSTGADQVMTWSGLTEDAETFSADGSTAMNYSVASTNFTTGSTGNTITCTMPSPSSNNICGVAVSMR